MSSENKPLVNPNKTYPLLEFYRISQRTYSAAIKKQGFTTALALEEITIPARKTKFSAGYDFITPVHITLKPGELKMIPTGIKCKIDAQGKYLALHLRSSIGVNYSLILINQVGIIDADYYDNPDNEGHIMLPIMNIGLNEVNIPIGTRIAQGIFTDYYITDNDTTEEVRKGGFGSTGKR